MWRRMCECQDELSQYQQLVFNLMEAPAYDIGLRRGKREEA